MRRTWACLARITHLTETGILIIGGGIVGVSAALHLAQRNAQVLLLEKDMLGAKASAVNFGGLRINGREAAEIPLSIRARTFWESIREHVGHDCEVEFAGHIEVTTQDTKMAEMERWARMARDHGLAPELLSARQIREDYPWLSARLIGGCRISTDGSANPRLATPLIGFAARRAGADIREKVAVIEVTHDGLAFEVSTNSGEQFRAAILINAAGAWGGKLADALGDRVPWLTLAPQMVVSEPLPACIRGIVDCDVGGRYLYIRQTARGNVLFGRGPGRVDLEAERAFVIPQNGFNASRIALDLVAGLKHYHILRTWSGVEGKMPDSLPVLDFSPRVPGLIHAFGFSGHGFQLGPGTGAVRADLALDGRTQINIEGFRISRFASNQQVECAPLFQR